MNFRLIAVSAAMTLSAFALPAAAAPLRPIPTPFTTLSAPADPAQFEFVVTGDNRSTGHGEPMPPSLDQICREIGLIKPAFTLWTGDVIEGYDDTPAEANAEYDVFLKSASLTSSPIFNAPGNHEFTLDPVNLLPIYRKRMGDLYGAFDYGNSHFVQLNSCSVEADGTVHDADFDAEQLAWLANDLQAHQSATNIFVFFHHYPFGPVDDNPKLDSGLASLEVRNKMHAIFVKYHVRAVFAGHNHRYYHTTKDGVDYYISGGAGAPLDAAPQEGGYLHYMLVHVNGASTSIDVLQPWHLLADPTTADCVHVANYQPVDVDVNNVVFRLPALPAGQKYAATATVGYKKKTKPAEATVVSVTPVAGTQLVDVAVATRCVKARTTRITVTATP